ncbi:MAG: Ig-like domain-containing protein [Bacteroidales bacterium]|nr:Ig-like domain-containing protein [Bacteroidales bacterium]
MKLRALTYLLLVAVAGFLWSCANIGSPSGGPRDYTPPVVLKSNPAPRAVNFKGKKVTIQFDEIVVLKDQQKKVVISPAQKEPAMVRSLGRTVEVTFNDELIPNTTYTIDFSDAIEDNNEGNRLDGYCFSFSTGESIDTMSVSGMVLRARDLEPMQHVMVGLHSNLDDTAFTATKFERISRTNDKGEFTVQGVKPGKYHIFALKDMDGNYRMSRSEDYAFLDEIIVPSVREFTSQDTTFTFDRRVDTVVTAKHNEYLPNDILLSMFNEGYTPLYLKKAERLGRNRLFVHFSTANELPQLNILSPQNHAVDWHVMERREGNDSIVYWLTDSTLIKADSIVVDMRYMKMDSLNNIVPATDTVVFLSRRTNAEIKAEREAKKEREEMDKEREKLIKKREKMIAEGKDVTDVDLDIKALAQREHAIREVLKLEPSKTSQLEVTDTLQFLFNAPIGSINQRGIRLEHMQKDSTWVRINAKMLQKDELNPLRYMIQANFKPDEQYRLSFDSAAVCNVYGVVNDSTTFKYKVKSLDEYGYVILHVNSGDSAFVELLDANEKVVRHQRVSGGTVRFDNLLPAEYYARLVVDTNGNDRWDPGYYTEHRQPEEVYYYPYADKLRVRKSWGREETWDIYATAINQQKPEKIKKNKPERRRDSLEQRVKQTDEEEEDEFGSNAFGRNTYSGNKYRDYQNNRR